MKIFLDTADTQLIQDGFNTGLIDGVTTNPYSHNERVVEIQKEYIKN